MIAVADSLVAFGLECISGGADVLVTLAGAFGYTIAVWPILRIRHWLAPFFTTGVAIVALLAPLLISADKVFARAATAFWCIELTFKMIEYARCQRGRRGGAGSFGDYLRFLIPFPPLSIRFGQRDRRLPAGRPWQPEVIRVVLGGGLFAAGVLLLDVATQIEALRSSFLLDHTVKFAMFVVAVEALSHVAYGLERLAGYDTRPLIDRAFASRTVGEFWWRYNTRVHRWLIDNVFRPCGGRQAPVRGVVLAFFVSAVFHELMFGIATSRFDGYQFTFFMLQVPAVLAARPIYRLATRGGPAGKFVAHSTTVLWMFGTSMFFFHGVNRVFPFFYAGEPWLP